MPRNTVIWDRVHDLVQLPKVVRRAMDTTEFQRLRLLKQLGIVSYVFPGTTHTRFEHSIGVAHLARTLVHELSVHQPDLGLTAHDEELAMLAGLCHDVGHGPFSHLFEDVISKNIGIHFDHEAMSVVLARRMLEPIMPESDVADVIGIMSGASKQKSKTGGVIFKNRWEGPRGVLCDIVSNKRCGVDVDKLDYFLRDSLSCYGRPTVDARYARLFNGARAVRGCSDDEADHWRLAFDVKHARDLREMWTLRAKLHAGVYQTPVVKRVGHMIGDALQLAEPHFDIDGRGTRLRDCLAAGQEDKFLMLGDWIVDAIAASGNPALQDAQLVLQHLRNRKMYPRLASVMLAPESPPYDESRVTESVLAMISDSTLREACRGLLITDVAHITTARSPTDDPLRKITWVKNKDTTGDSSTVQPFKYSHAATRSVFDPATQTERSLVFVARWNAVGNGSGDARTSLEAPGVREALYKACVAWIAGERQSGFIQPEALVAA